MARACQLIGGALTILGIAIALTFMIVMRRDAAFFRAELAFSLNPGNVMYEAEYRGAQVRRAFEGVAVGAGMLLAVNGATLVGLGTVAARLRRPGS